MNAGQNAAGTSYPTVLAFAYVTLCAFVGLTAVTPLISPNPFIL